MYHPNHVIYMFLNILDGLLTAQNIKICHRDIKPANILVNVLNDNQVLYVLCDFGEGKIAEDNYKKLSIRGTPRYLANELLLYYDVDNNEFT